LSAQAKYGGGTGEPNDPYQIWDANHMQAIGADANDWDKHFKLMADMDLGGFTGTSFNIIGTYWRNPFTGVFDGNGRTISNFTYISTGTSYIGLFGYVGGLIKDLGLIDPNVDAGTEHDVGSLVGLLINGTVTNCYIEGGSVVGLYIVGGLVGGNYYGTITDSYWDIETSDEPNMCGSQPYGTGCDPNYGKTTAQMHQQSTFEGWDFINVWNIGENQTYPYLRTYLTGDINKDRTVNFLDFCIIANQWMEEE
jgi:hypothetical protein